MEIVSRMLLVKSLKFVLVLSVIALLSPRNYEPFLQVISRRRLDQTFYDTEVLCVVDISPATAAATFKSILEFQ